MMGSDAQKSATEALVRRTVRKFAVFSFLIMAVVLLAFVLLLNVWSRTYSNAHIDARSRYQVETFVSEHRSSGEHTYGLSTSFIPVVYIELDDGTFLNLHPTDDIPSADLATLLAREVTPGDSSVTINGRVYRVHYEREDVDIHEGDELYHARGLLLLRDISTETDLSATLGEMSVIAYLVSLVAIAPIGYFMARRSVVPLRDAWERQRQFSADASHKLKTPLAVILANVEMVLRHPEHRVADEAPALEATLENAGKMRNTLGDLLTLTQVEDGIADHVDTVVDLGDVAEQLYEDLGQLAAKKGVRFEIGTDRGALVLGDQDRLEEMATVFIENAIHYTPSGGEVSVDCRPVGKHVVLTVCDTGMGMDAQTVARVFDRFYRADGARDANPQGTGLGLPIAQWIVERHGGRIEIASKPGEGTTVRVLLPLHAA